MSFYEHDKEFAGRPVTEWSPLEVEDAVENEGARPSRKKPKPGAPGKAGKAGAGAGVYRISLDYEESEEGATWTDKFDRFLEDPAATGCAGLVVGPWSYDEMVGGEAGAAQLVERLAAARARLPQLRHIFFGDITSEECEVSWINQTDVSPLLEAYPALETLRVRGAMGLSLGTLRHKNARTLIVESGGLPAALVRQIAGAKLPSLEHLELWLGTASYGGDSTVDDLKPILAGKSFPSLKYLGLRDSDKADEVARAAARSEIVKRLEVLDLSMGNLTDDGAAVFLDEKLTDVLKKLKKIDLRHHFCSPWMQKKLQETGLRVDASDPQEPYTWGGELHRFVAVSE